MTIPEMITNTLLGARERIEKDTATIASLERDLERAKMRLQSSEEEFERAKAFFETYYGQPYNGIW